MAIHDVTVKVGFLDSAERIAERSFLLRQTYDDVANDYDDVVTAAGLLITALDALTWDHIEYYDIQVRTAGTGAVANVAANNQVTAFTRVMDVDGNAGSFEVPAWDDFTYDQDHNNLLSAAYNTAAAAVALLTRNPVSLVNWVVGVAFSQSRTRKSGIKLD